MNQRLYAVNDDAMSCFFDVPLPVNTPDCVHAHLYTGDLYCTFTKQWQIEF